MDWRCLFPAYMVLFTHSHLKFSCITYLTSYHWTFFCPSRRRKGTAGNKKSPCPCKTGTRAVSILRYHPNWLFQKPTFFAYKHTRSANNDSSRRQPLLGAQRRCSVCPHRSIQQRSRLRLFTCRRLSVGLRHCLLFLLFGLCDVICHLGYTCPRSLSTVRILIFSKSRECLSAESLNTTNWMGLKMYMVR